MRFLIRKCSNDLSTLSAVHLSLELMRNRTSVIGHFSAFTIFRAKLINGSLIKKKTSNFFISLLQSCIVLINIS